MPLISSWQPCVQMQNWNRHRYPVPWRWNSVRPENEDTLPGPTGTKSRYITWKRQVQSSVLGRATCYEIKGKENPVLVKQQTNTQQSWESGTEDPGRLAGPPGSPKPPARAGARERPCFSRHSTQPTTECRDTESTAPAWPPPRWSRPRPGGMTAEDRCLAWGCVSPLFQKQRRTLYRRSDRHLGRAAKEWGGAARRVTTGQILIMMEAGKWVLQFIIPNFLNV